MHDAHSQADELKDPKSYGSRPLTCDLVMKGGITSGVVYPQAVAQLARTYRFANIGGTSAGSIAAAAAAAAQHRGDGEGFAKLAALPDRLGSELEALFRPQRMCSRLFGLALTLTKKPDSVMGRLRRYVALLVALVRFLATPTGLAILIVLGLPAIGTGIGLGDELAAAGLHGAALLVLIAVALSLARTAVRTARSDDETGENSKRGPLPSLTGALAGVAAAVVVAVDGGVDAWVCAAWLAICVATWSVAVLVAIAVEAVRVLPANDYGMVGGSAYDTKTTSIEPLSEWLHGLIQDLAGLGPDDDPLTFGDLLGGPGGDGVNGVNLTLLTTCITQGRTYYLPYDLELDDEHDRFYVDPDELERSMPADVVRVLRRPPTEPDWLDLSLAPYVRLPEPADLPVVMATRMSLSFPLLISAVPLRAVDWTRASNQEARRQWREWERERKTNPDAPPPEVPPEAEPCWFSDGGIISNFPVHLFDHMLPGHPTFGVNLRGFHPDRTAFDSDDQPEGEKIWRPPHNGSGQSEWWTRWPSGGSSALSGFAGAIKNTVQNWSDNDQTRVPGYRDRVVHVSHGKREGGLNLSMPQKRIERLGERGRLAAVELEAAFAHRDPPEGVVTGWRNHKWVRLRSSLALLANELESIANHLDVDDPTGVESYLDLLDGPLDDAPSYQATRGQRDALLAFLVGDPDDDASCGVIGASTELSEKIREQPTLSPERKAPGPEPDLRITPGHRQGPRKAEPS